jgi:asparagine synthase (glutamine-hydrolysing)
MCGIAGVIGSARDEDLHRDIRRMCDAIAHRGPDDAGYHVAAGGAIGMRRLSIIDLAGGHQPIPNEDESLWIVFNGEIYNHHQLRAELEARGHRFRTHSDTEVILHGFEEWGRDAVRRLQGMFAFAIWDVKRSRLFLARDPLGIKPLYFWPMQEGVAFGSELRSFLALPHFPRALSREALLAYLALGYVPHPLAVFEACSKLPPGCWLEWSAEGGVKVSRYWDPTTIDVAEGIDEQEAIRRLRQLLQEAVESQLESEVPLGAFLSGGLDSSAVVGLMVRACTRRVRTFSIGFDLGTHDESGHAAAVARALGTEHTAMQLRPSAGLLIEHAVSNHDEPFADASSMPTLLVSALAREHVTVALSGDGGDELFGGYSWYQALAGNPEAPPAWAPPIQWAANRMSPWVRGRGRLLDLVEPRRQRFDARHVLPLSVAQGGIVRTEAVDRLKQGGWFDDTWTRVQHRDFVSQMSMVDLRHYMPGDILTKVDRASMAVSLEARPPLLHLPLVEFALSLPGIMKVRRGQTKALFRKAIEGLVPDAVLRYPKRGFVVPLGDWLGGELYAQAQRAGALSEMLPDLVDPEALREVLVHAGSRSSLHASLVWRIMVLHRWLGHLESGDLARPIPRLHPSELEGRQSARLAKPA